MSDKLYRRTHPYTVFSHLKISAILILIPVVQEILYTPQNLFEIISTLSANTLYAIALIIFSIYSYRFHLYRTTYDAIEIKKGLLIKQYYCVPFDRIYTINIYKNIFSLPLGAHKISFDTPSGSSRHYDISAYFDTELSRKTEKRIAGNNTPMYNYKSKYLYMLLMSAFWSNPATGLLFAAPFISRLGDVLGYEIQNTVLSTMDEFWHSLSIDIPPIAATIANILVLGWAIALTLQFLRYAGFESYVIGDYIAVRRGILSKSITYTRRDRLAAVTIDQSLFMWLLGLYSAGVFMIGSGKLKGDRGLIIAAEKKEKINYRVKEFAALNDDDSNSLRPKKNTIYSYICLPLWIIIVITALLITADSFSVINEFFRVLMLFALIPLVWWTLFRLFARSRSFAAVNDDCVIMCSYDRLTLKKYIIPKDKVQYVSITQSIFQKRKNTCSVRVYMYFEKRACHIVKHIDADRAREMFGFAANGGKK